MKKITINKKKCLGCGACTFIAEKTFIIKKGKVEVKDNQIDSDKKVQEAIDSCPVGAINRSTSKQARK